MKKNILKVFAVIGVMTLVFTGCKKYEEGPALSLASKKSRVAGEWKIEQVLYNGSDQTANFQALLGSDYVLTMTKDGTYTATAGGSSNSGTWKFSDNKEELIMLDNDPGSTEDKSTILKLKSKELWIKDVSGSNTTEIHYKQ